MMGRGAFILLKGGRGRLESAKQDKIRLAILLNILWILRSAARNPPQRTRHGCVHCCFPRDMANSMKVARFVMWIPILAAKLQHYPASTCKNKMMNV
jgi:hypothetical protein